MARPKADLFVQVIALCRRIDALATLRVANLIKKRKEIEIILLKNAKIVQNGSLPENRCIGVFARCELKRFMSVFCKDWSQLHYLEDMNLFIANLIKKEGNRDYFVKKCQNCSKWLFAGESMHWCLCALRTKEVHVRFLQRLESAALPRGHEPLYCEPNKKGRK